MSCQAKGAETHATCAVEPADPEIVREGLHICSERQRSVESLSSPLSPLSESLSLPESLESLLSPLSPESASSPLSPSLTVAPPCARTPGQTVLMSSSSNWVVSTPITEPPVLRDVRLPTYHPRPRATPYNRPQGPSPHTFPPTRPGATRSDSSIAAVTTCR